MSDAESCWHCGRVLRRSEDAAQCACGKVYFAGQRGRPESKTTAPGFGGLFKVTLTLRGSDE